MTREDGRKAMLDRIRDALRAAGPREASVEGWRSFLPPAGSTRDERVRLFAGHAAALAAEFETIGDRASLAERLRAVARKEGWKKVATHRGALTDEACGGIEVPVLRTDEGFDPNELESCDAGVTECEALVAQTGSVLVTSRSSGGRALSVLPPHHVVLATGDQLVGDLADAYRILRDRYGDDPPSLVSFLTGPSRTGDIERTLVLGAHGPKRLTIWLVNDD